MHERYRNMMERETLSEETKVAILKRMEQEDVGNAGRQSLRIALIAACLCLVLMGMAFAVAATDGFGLWASITQKEDDGYTMEVSNRLKLYAVDAFSPALQADLTGLEETGTVLVRPENWQVAVDYVGVPLLENTLLDDRELFKIESLPKEDDIWQLQVDLHPGLVFISRAYEMDGALVNVQTGVFTQQYDGGVIYDEWLPFWWDNFGLDSEDGVTAHAAYDEVFHNVFTVDEAWVETMANGVEVLFLRTKNSDGTRYWYSASFLYDGIAYHIGVYDAEEQRAWLQSFDEEKFPRNPDLNYEDVLWQVIDGFEFE